MIRTIKLQLVLSEEDLSSILRTMQEYTVAFNICSEWGFKNHSFNRISCHNATYYQTREVVPTLPSSVVQGARDCACDALRSIEGRSKPVHKEFGAMRYQKRVIHIYLERGYVTIATSNGRVKGHFGIPIYYKKYLGWTVKSCDVVFNKRDNLVYLHCQVESQTPEHIKDISVLGIDRGINNIAVCSDNTFFNSKAMKNTRAKYAYLRASLQSKGTRSAKRKLRKLSGRERRFVTDVNHCISKQIVQTPFTIFALESLTNIQLNKHWGKKRNRKLNSWAFFELGGMIQYKAENLGKQVIFVDPKHTSQKCSNCGFVHKTNRKGTTFKCRECGFELHSDLNASRNIAHIGISDLGRLPANQPIVACS